MKKKRGQEEGKRGGMYTKNGAYATTGGRLPGPR